MPQPPPFEDKGRPVKTEIVVRNTYPDGSVGKHVWDVYAPTIRESRDVMAVYGKLTLENFGRVSRLEPVHGTHRLTIKALVKGSPIGKEIGKPERPTGRVITEGADPRR